MIPNLAMQQLGQLFLPPQLHPLAQLFSLWQMSQQPQSVSPITPISSAVGRAAGNVPFTAPPAPVDPFAGLRPEFPNTQPTSSGYMNGQPYAGVLDQFFRLPDGRYVNSIAHQMNLQAAERSRDGVYR